MFESFEIAKILLPRQQFQPFPGIGQRRAWHNLPPAVSQALLQNGEAALGFQWPALPATLFLEFTRTGNRTHYETPHFARRDALADLVLAECLEDRGRFLDDIANGIWAICEESYWGIPAHIFVQKAGPGLPDVSEPTVDLFAAETAALLAWTDYLLGDRLDAVSPLLRPRLLLETRRRVLEPCLQRDDFWWMGFPETRAVNNWNPWINSNWLAAALLLESEELTRQATVQKILRSLEYFLDVYGEAGGCDEGPGYWGRAAASLFDCLELLLPATAGALDVYDRPKIQNMGRFICLTHIHDSYYVNFADASATNTPDAALVFRYGERIGDVSMQAFGAWLAEGSGPAARLKHQGLGRLLPALFQMDNLPAVTPAQPLPGVAWFADIQVLAARDQEGSACGLFLAAKGGHNAESHNHNDVGNFIIFKDGKPVIVDAGVETYSRKTFSPQRYEIWTMQSAYHSLLPSFLVGSDWLQQLPGKEYAARAVACDPGIPTLSLDLAGAYPAKACLLHWNRHLELQRGRQVIVSDRFAFDEARLQQGGALKAIRLSLLTPCVVGEVPAEAGDGGTSVLELRPRELLPGRVSGSCRLLYPVGVFRVAVESVAIDDECLSPVWGSQLNRILLIAWEPPLLASWQFSFLEADHLGFY
jgi:hypothetical protein